MFQFPAFASNPYVFKVRYLFNDTWKPEQLNRPASVKNDLFVLTLSRLRASLRTGRRISADGLAACMGSPIQAARSSLSTVQIFQVSKVGCPIRRSMDQSLFAAPHGLSQRITSFFACACQGIHQMPLRHLIVLIANAHLPATH